MQDEAVMRADIATNFEGMRMQGFLAVVAVLLATFVWVVGWYWPTAADMAGIWWRSDTFAHGLVVLPIFLWLVWRKRELVGGLSPMPAPAMVMAIAAAGFVWLLAELVSAASLAHFALTALLVVSFVAAIGWRLARVLAFPLLFLFFAVPVGEFLLPTLMHYTAEFTVFALRATGIPVFQENLFFVVPNGRWSVVEACSGLRYMIASLMVGSLYAYLNYTSLKRRLLFMLVALLVPIVANWIRAYITVMVGYTFGNEFVEGFIHIVYGWVFFGIVIFVMFWIGSFWREGAPATPTATVSPAPVAPRSWFTLLSAAAAIAFFPLLASQLQKPVEPFSVALAAPAAVDGWQAVEGEALAYQPSFRGHRGELYQLYRRADGAQAALYIAYYAEQRQGEEMVMFGNTLNGREGSGWRRLRTVDTRVAVGPVREAILKRGDNHQRVLSWYWINGRVINNDYLAKALLALDRLTARKDDSAVIAITVPAAEYGEDGRVVAEAFIEDFAPAIEAMLAGVEARR